MTNKGYCVPYDHSEQSKEINDLISELVEKFGLLPNKLLCHCKRKNYDIKTGCVKGSHPGIEEYVKGKKLKVSINGKMCKIKITEGKGSPGGSCRGSNGFKVEYEKCDEFNNRNSLQQTKLLKSLPEYKKDNFIIVCTNIKENTRRPLKSDNLQLKITQNDIRNISDMKVHFNDIHNKSSGILFISTEYISQKSTGLVTFMNIGVNNINCFREKDIKNYVVSTELGKTILHTLGINKDAFCAVFNYYDQSNIEMISEIANKHNQIINIEDNTHSESFINNIQCLLNQSLGDGDMIISHNINNSDLLYRSKSLDTSVLRYKSFYGGKLKKGKRIDIEIYTRSLIFTINIRNKQGGIYPSHIMCDFKYYSDQKSP